MIIILTPVRVRMIIVATLAAVVATVTAAFAAGGDSTARDPGSVIAGFYPPAFAAEQLVPGARVTNLTPAGAEPHALELSPADVKNNHAAGAVLVLGHGFQPQLERAAGGCFHGYCGDVERAARSAPHLFVVPGVDRRGPAPSTLFHSPTFFR